MYLIGNHDWTSTVCYDCQEQTCQLRFTDSNRFRVLPGVSIPPGSVVPQVIKQFRSSAMVRGGNLPPNHILKRKGEHVEVCSKAITHHVE